MILVVQVRNRAALAAVAAIVLLVTLYLLDAAYGQSATVAEKECTLPSESGECIDDSFLSDVVFSPDTDEETASNPFPHLHEKPKEDAWSGLASTVQSILGLTPTDSSETPMLDSLYQTARAMTERSDRMRTPGEKLDVFYKALQKVFDVIKKEFKILRTTEGRLHPFSLLYYVEHEDERKNPSWKRRKHRYNRGLEQDTAIELHNALYLSHLSYADSKQVIQDGLKQFMNNTYELIYTQLAGFPGEPAHFIAVKKQAKRLDPIDAVLPWNANKVSTLQVLMVVRGTMEVADILTDAIMEAVDYRDGFAHAGIMQAGRYLVEKHVDTLKRLLQISGHQKISLSLVGHSLGAGSASIAAIEFNEYDFIEASAIGIGCPALLSLNVSESTRDYITTVVSDADMVPRMSGATVANLVLDLMSFDFTANVLTDMREFLIFLNASVPFINIPMQALLDAVSEEMDRAYRPAFAKVTKERVDPLLYPPGRCIHLFRDGAGVSGSYIPCRFFDGLDLTRTLVDDHLTLFGYHRILLHFVRDKLKDWRFDFDHDIVGLPIT